MKVKVPVPTFQMYNSYIVCIPSGPDDVKSKILLFFVAFYDKNWSV